MEENDDLCFEGTFDTVKEYKERLKYRVSKSEVEFAYQGGGLQEEIRDKQVCLCGFRACDLPSVDKTLVWPLPRTKVGFVEECLLNRAGVKGKGAKGIIKFIHDEVLENAGLERKRHVYGFKKHHYHKGDRITRLGDPFLNLRKTTKEPEEMRWARSQVERFKKHAEATVAGLVCIPPPPGVSLSKVLARGRASATSRGAMDEGETSDGSIAMTSDDDDDEVVDEEAASARLDAHVEDQVREDEKRRALQLRGLQRDATMMAEFAETMDYNRDMFPHHQEQHEEDDTRTEHEKFLADVFGEGEPTTSDDEDVAPPVDPRTEDNDDPNTRGSQTSPMDPKFLRQQEKAWSHLRKIDKRGHRGGARLFSLGVACPPQ